MTQTQIRKDLRNGFNSKASETQNYKLDHLIIHETFSPCRNENLENALQNISNSLSKRNCAVDKQEIDVFRHAFTEVREDMKMTMIH